jgi:hypothetical protein
VLARLAKIAEEFKDRICQCRRIQPIDHVLSATLIDDEIGFSQHRQMT